MHERERANKDLLCLIQVCIDSVWERSVIHLAAVNKHIPEEQRGLHVVVEVAAACFEHLVSVIAIALNEVCVQTIALNIVCM